MDPRVVERREGGGLPGAGREGTDGLTRGQESFGQMETWNPVGDSSSGSVGPGAAGGNIQPGDQAQRQRQARGQPNSKDAFDNAGNWGDDFPAAEDWDNDEYTGSLSDTKVFTQSSAQASLSQPKSAIGEPLNGSISGLGVGVGQTGSHPGSHPGLGPGGAQQPNQGATGAPTPANNSLSGSSYSQPIDISALLQKPGGLRDQGAPPSALSQFQQVATKELKSAIGLAPGQSSSLSYS